MRNTRTSTQIRSLHITPHVFEYADGSVLIELGKTKVLCAVTLHDKVPPFLKGSKTGWLTAHYNMLPTSCQNRIERDIQLGKQNGRHVEISRLIGRCLRSVVTLEPLGEKTIIVDCDVLQADGGTRTAAITGAGLALQLAQVAWLEKKIIKQPILRDSIAAVSVGIKDGEILVDLDYQEDSTIDADFNIVMSKSGGIIEVQGTAEKAPVSFDAFNNSCEIAKIVLLDMFNILDSTTSAITPSLSFRNQLILER